MDRTFAEAMALRLRRGEREIVAAKASALAAVGAAADRGVVGVDKLKAAVNAYVSPDLLSAAALLSQFAKMADELEPVIAEAERKGWAAWSEESPEAAGAIMDFVAEFSRARGVAMEAVQSGEKALAGFKRRSRRQRLRRNGVVAEICFVALFDVFICYTPDAPFLGGF